MPPVFAFIHGYWGLGVGAVSEVCDFFRLAKIVQTGERVTFVVAIIIALLGLSSLETIPLLVVLVLLMLAPVFSGFKVWIRRLSAA